MAWPEGKDPLWAPGGGRYWKKSPRFPPAGRALPRLRLSSSFHSPELSSASAERLVVSASRSFPVPRATR